MSEPAASSPAVDSDRGTTISRIIMAVIAFSLLVLVGIIIYFLLLIARSSPASPVAFQPDPSPSVEAFVPPTPQTPVDNPGPPPIDDSSGALYIPLTQHDDGYPDIRSPFSLQVAALHQMSIDAVQTGDRSNADSAQEGDVLNDELSLQSPLAEAIKDSGADWVRVRIEWELVEPNKPVPGQLPGYDWKYHDDNLGLIAGAGVRIIATLSDSPGWAASSPCAPIYSHRLDDFTRYLADLVNRYKEPPFYIKHWELVNEPDSNRYDSGHESGHGCWAYDGEQYAKMLSAAYKAIKAADPDATVLMGGIAYDWFEQYGGPFYRYFIDQVMVNGGGDYADILNFHFFTDFKAEWERWNPDSVDRNFGWIPAPTCGSVDDGRGTQYDVQGIDIIAKTTHFRNRMDACYGVSKPIWVTEVGVHGYAGDPGSQEVQARYVPKVYARALSAGVGNITWFSLDQPPYDPFGQALLNADFSPKPAFFAYQTLTRELHGFYEFLQDRNICSWSSSGATCSLEAYTFKNESGEEKTVAWGRDVLPIEAGQLLVVDRSGNQVFIDDGGDGDQDGLQNGTIELQLTDDPVYVSTR